MDYKYYFVKPIYFASYFYFDRGNVSYHRKVWLSNGWMFFFNKI